MLVSSPVSIVEIAGIPLWICAVIGLRHTYKLMLWSIVSPISLVIIAWTAFRFLSLTWSPDVVLGLDHLASLRWLWAIPMLAPVLDQRRALVSALSAGVALGMLAQLVNWIGPALNLYDPIWIRAEDRFSGWWHPVIAGTILVASLGLHAPIAICTTGRNRMLAITLILCACVAIMATGSRGAWIEGAAVLSMIALAVFVRLVQIAAGRRIWLVFGGFATVIVLVCGAAWMLFGTSISARYELARNEITQAIDQQNYSTDTGARMAMLVMGWQCFTHHAVLGVGEGGFASWSRTQLAQSSDPEIDVNRVIHNHAHNTYVHTLATGGILSALSGACMIVFAIGNAFSVLPGPNQRNNGLQLTPSHIYAIAPACALLAIMVAGLFDSIHINAQTSAWVFTLVALCQHEPVRDGDT